MPAYHAASGSAAEDLFIELFSDTFGAEKAGYLYSQYNAGIAACQEGGKKCLGSAAEKSPPAAGGRG